MIRDTIEVLDMIPPDVGLPVTPGPAATPQMTEPEEANISASAPPVSTTKGSRRRLPEMDDMPQPHFQRDKRKKRRKCGKCGLYDTGHNAATCDRAQNQQANKRPRGRPKGSSNGGGEQSRLEQEM
jgi:hypothetical protein